MKDKLKQAIINGDIETLKESVENRMPTTIAFIDVEGKEPTSYFVVGVGTLSAEEYEQYLKQIKTERRKQ